MNKMDNFRPSPRVDARLVLPRASLPVRDHSAQEPAALLLGRLAVEGPSAIAWIRQF